MFCKVTTREREQIKELVPGSLIGELDLPGQYATTWREDGRMIGIICYYMDPKPLTERYIAIRWVYVLPEYRKKGYGRKLFEHLCEFAKKKDVAEIRVTFAEVEETINLLHLFNEMEFTYVRSGIGQLYTTLGQIQGVMTVGEKHMSHKMIPLSAITAEQFRMYYARLHENQKHNEEYLLPEEIEKYDPQASIVLVTPMGEIVAAHLCRYINHSIEASLIAVGGEKKAIDRVGLYNKSIEAATAKYGKDMQVKIRSKENEPWDAYMKLFNEIKATPCVQGFMRID